VTNEKLAMGLRSRAVGGPKGGARSVAKGWASPAGFNEELIDGVEGDIRDASRSSHAGSLDEKMEDLGALVRRELVHAP